MELLFVGVEVVIDSIEEGAGSSVELRLLVEFVRSDEFPQDALLAEVLLVGGGILPCHKRIIVVAIVIDIVGVELKDIVLVSLDEVVAASRVGVQLAGHLPVDEEVGIHEVMLDHVVHLAVVERAAPEVHDPVADEEAPQADRVGRTPQIVLVQEDGQVGDVLARVGLARNPERVVPVLAELREEVEDSVEGVVGHEGVVELEVLVQVVGVSNSCGRLDEQQVRGLVPGVGVLGQVVLLLVADSVGQHVGADLLDEPWVSASGTEHRRAAWAAVQPQSHWVFIVVAVDRAHEHVVEASVGVSCREVARVHREVEVFGVALP